MTSVKDVISNWNFLLDRNVLKFVLSKSKDTFLETLISYQADNLSQKTQVGKPGVLRKSIRKT